MNSTPNSTPTRHHRGAERRGLALAATALLSFGAVACSAETSTSPETSTIPATGAGAEERSWAGVALTDDEVAGLLWIREEEQLAHDVYTTLGQIWDVRIFENIASSERSHIDAALRVLDNYGIEDPAAGNELGTFTEPQIQALYDQLVADGSGSLVAALQVGALIEELDITDLRLRSSATEVDTLAGLYANLEKGSRNHLRAFTSQLEARDVVYEPTQLDVDDYEMIVSSPTERGHDA